MIRYVVSTYKTGRWSVLNRIYHRNLKKVLEFHGVKFTEVEGQYKGTAERGFMVANKKLAMKIMKDYEQEAILEINTNKDRAALIFSKGNRKHIGKTIVTKIKPETDFTKIGDDYVTVR